MEGSLALFRRLMLIKDNNDCNSHIDSFLKVLCINWKVCSLISLSCGWIGSSGRKKEEWGEKEGEFSNIRSRASSGEWNDLGQPMLLTKILISFMAPTCWIRGRNFEYSKKSCKFGRMKWFGTTHVTNRNSNFFYGSNLLKKSLAWPKSFHFHSLLSHENSQLCLLLSWDQFE